MRASLNQVLSLAKIDDDCFRAVHHKENFQGTLFGGQVIAQALMAAGFTSEDVPPHSMHAYFLRAGTSKMPVDYRVTRTRDGRSFKSRSIEAVQDGKTILSMMASFHHRESGYEHQQDWGVKPQFPGEVASQAPPELAPGQPELKVDSFDIHPLGQGMLTESSCDEDRVRFWVRCNETLGASLLTQACALAYASDFGLLASALSKHPASLFNGSVIGASVDHALWFHCPDLQVDDWVFYDIHSPWAGNARGFSTGRVYSQDGKLLASAAQEGLIRPKKPL